MLILKIKILALKKNKLKKKNCFCIQIFTFPDSYLVIHIIYIWKINFHKFQGHHIVLNVLAQYLLSLHESFMLKP